LGKRPIARRGLVNYLYEDRRESRNERCERKERQSEEKIRRQERRGRMKR
jgi:hypothetical protein